MLKNNTKTKPGSIAGRLAALPGLLLIALLAGCSDQSPITPAITQSAPEGLAQPNIQFQVSYDETAMVFTPFWPEDMTAALKSEGGASLANAEDSEFMIDYDKTHHVVGIKDDRTLYLEVSHLEGSASQNMPDELYNDVKDEMPTRSPKQLGPVKTVIQNGVMTLYFADGTTETVEKEGGADVMSEEDYNAWLEYVHNQDTSDVDSRISSNLEAYQSESLNFKRLSENEIYYEYRPEEEDENGIALVKQRLDLRTGEVVMSASQFPDGRYESVAYMSYDLVEGIPVLASSETYVFGNHMGQWTATQRHVLNRENIRVIRNN